MPQRKKPISGKAKKEILKAKRQRKHAALDSGNQPRAELSTISKPLQPVQKFNYVPNKDGKCDTNRYALQFYRESNEEIKQRKEEALHTVEPVPEREIEIDNDEYFPMELSFPQRPPWSYELSRNALEERETQYFNDYVNGIHGKYGPKEVGYFELNLETWRQLWRVLEMSDIVLLIVDIRFPAHMFPPSLYNYVVNDLKKHFILVLNKIDLAPAPVVVAWKKFFEEKYPSLHIAMFTSLPGYNLVGNHENKAGLLLRKKRGRFRLAAEGSQLLYDVCKDIVDNDEDAKNSIDISSWQTKIKEEMHMEFDYGREGRESDDDDDVQVGETIELKSVDCGYYVHEKYKSGVLTIGCLGQPNVGKSSIINALMGRKVVSVSRTPGHTKHFQTIFLTDQVRLCDCPGLVFPSKVPKMLQVLMGSYPIAQMREPFTTIKFMAQRLNLPRMLRIDHPENDDTWSAMDICDGWAKKRGYFTAKSGRLDSHRAANELLRMALDGKICLCLRPPLYTEKKEYWESHPENERVRWIQAKSTEGVQSTYNKNANLDDEDEFSDSAHDSDAEATQSNSDNEISSSDEELQRGTFNKFALLDNSVE